MKVQRSLIITGIVIFSLMLVGAALFSARASNQPDPQPPSLPEAIQLINEPSDWTVVRLYFNDRDHLNQVAGQLDIWEINKKSNYAVVALSPEKYHWLEVQGYRMQVDAEKTALIQAPMAPLDPRFHYFDDYYPNPNGLYVVDFLTSTNTAYPDLTELVDIGDAWLAGQPGQYDRDIWVLRITNEDPAYGDIADKPVFFLFANIHAREVALPELTIRYIKYLTSGYDGEGGYGLDPDATWLVNHNVLYVLVMQNPDGHWVNEQNTSAYRRKNMDNDDGCNISSQWGVDLNRNHSFLWDCCGGSSGDPCGETYRGPSKASEPETQAFQSFFATVVEDQNGPNGDDEIPPASPSNTTGLFLSLHSYGDEVLWPWGFTINPSPNFNELQTIGRKLAYYNNFDPTGFLYTVDGATDDWTYGKFGVASFTFEVGPGGGTCGGFFPDYECIEGESGYPQNFWAENKPAFLYAHKIARTPYMTSYGPDAQDLATVPTIITPDEPVQLYATIEDHRYGGDPLAPIYGAEFFINTPGEDGTGTPMSPVDGGWGDLSEVVSGTLDTTGLPLGQHYILVHGVNDDGDWGPFTAIFLYIMEPGVSPVIEGYVRDINFNFPLEASVTAGQFQTSSDPINGYYNMLVLSGTYDINAVAPGYAISTATGVQVQNYQTLQQDFYLEPICDLFFDDVESGNIGWTAQHLWAITDEASNSPSHSWTDSPGGNYGNYWNYSLTSPALDLSGYENIGLSFWHIYDLENGYDYGYLEYSTNGGATWSGIDSYNGEDQTNWVQESYVVPALDDESNARIRFRLYTDQSVTNDGWHIDDIRITGSGTECNPYTIPIAEFTSNSPVELGDPMQFTNLTAGTQPITYQWDFGDDLGTSTETHPAYTYQQTGDYTVTLVATNTFGTDDANHIVTVLPKSCTTINTIDLTQTTTGTIYSGDSVYLSADLSPDDAEKPYTYTVDYGDGLPSVTDNSVDDPLVISHTFNMTGTFNVEFGAQNCSMVKPVTDTLTLSVYEPGVCMDLSEISILGPTSGTPGIYTFTTSYEPVDATQPISYSWDNGDTTSKSVRTLDVGEYTLTVTATNCTEALAIDTHAITISPQYDHKQFLPIIIRGDGAVTAHAPIIPSSMVLTLPPLLAAGLLSTRLIRRRV